MNETIGELKRKKSSLLSNSAAGDKPDPELTRQKTSKNLDTTQPYTPTKKGSITDDSLQVPEKGPMRTHSDNLHTSPQGHMTEIKLLESEDSGFHPLGTISNDMDMSRINMTSEIQNTEFGGRNRARVFSGDMTDKSPLKRALTSVARGRLQTADNYLDDSELKQLERSLSIIEDESRLSRMISRADSRVFPVDDFEKFVKETEHTSPTMPRRNNLMLAGNMGFPKRSITTINDRVGNLVRQESLTNSIEKLDLLAMSCNYWNT